MSEEGKEMDFWGHLGVLRKILYKVAAVVIAVGVLLFIYMPWIFDNVILAPCDSDFVVYRWFAGLHGDGSLLPDMASTDFHVDLINYSLTAQLNTQVSLAFWGACILCCPYIIYMLWTFVSPGLYPHEREKAVPAFLFGNVMFYAGMACSYYLVFPFCLRFLAEYQISEQVVNTISLSSYIDNFLMLTLLMGLAFELPLICWVLGKMGMITRRFFTQYRRHAIVALVVLAAIITPTGDPLTLALVFAPLYMLWEVSALLVPKEKAADKDAVEKA